MRSEGGPIAAASTKLLHSLRSSDNDTPAAMSTPTLVSLLHALTSPDNDARNRAEQAFNGLKESDPEVIMYGLLEVSVLVPAPRRVRCFFHGRLKCLLLFFALLGFARGSHAATPFLAVLGWVAKQ